MKDHEYIREVLLGEFARHAKEKAADYDGSDGEENHRVLGVRGQFADIWRKIGKLKNALWDGRTLKGEQPREILMDLIGHAFLTIAMLDRAAGKWPVNVPVPPETLPRPPLVDLEALAAHADREAKQTRLAGSTGGPV